ncbi:Na(+)/H(+) antiporter subunit D [Halostella sp. JP-L12]|uniref:Na(+)/H(+) antiporter subunit D n=1 Tax=Halostella TaxID=1843185 RepID=UPI000EF7F6AF|nr:MULTISPECIES: Na(+)/H(+) antiporter subunit D [Halostella]NHN47396.1 Na(+)/H(+) antiporter subunit D [Halostella sp. JP-L12]
MVEFTAVPPALPVLVVALLLPLLSRRVGHALGVLVTAAVLAWSYLVPEGAYLDVAFLGFDAVLFNVDQFSRIMGIIFGLIGATAVVYSYYSDARNVQTAYALSYVGTSLGAVFAGDWLTLIFFWELMAITSTLLVWDYGGPAVRAGFRYALLHGIGGSLLMAGIVWHYAEVGTFLFGSLEGVAHAPGMAGTVPQVLAALGIGVNVGFVGLHAWLPDTYPRPHIAASVFLCVFTTKTGVYGMFRAFPDGHVWIAYMGGAMAVFGASMALLQNDMRRLLSYHIQSQVGYMVAGVGIPAALATSGAFGHVFNHILYKSLLFMTVGAVIYRTGEESLKKVGGLAREMPVTALAFTVAALSIAGFPGFNGFVSKGMVVTAAHKKHWDALWYLLLAGGVGTFMSFIKLGYYVFYHGDRSHSVPDANRGQQVAMLSIAALCVVYGLVPDALFAILPGQGAEEAHPYTIPHIQEVLVLAAIALVGFFLLKKPLKKLAGVPDVDAVYEPLTFYGTRGVVRGVTEAYAAVDRAAVAVAESAMAAARDPARVKRYVPGGREEIGMDPEQGHAPMDTTVGTSILILTVVLTLALVVLLA